jgi:AcrR family transcriptional regulator
MFTNNVKRAEVSSPRRRGRPPGRTEKGEETRDLLYGIALQLIAERGYQESTLRELAKRAEVSPALLYKYFPNKRAVLLRLYDDLSAELSTRALEMPSGRWRDRFLFSLTTSLEVLRPHRKTLTALIPALVGVGEEGIFSSATSFSRTRVQGVFERAVGSANDTPRSDAADALGRLLYLLHLAVILWWLLDRSPQERATTALIGLIKRVLPAFAAALRLKSVRSFVISGDQLITDAFLHPATENQAQAHS